MRLVIATDNWAPMVNGIVRVLEAARRELPALGVEVTMITPDDFPNAGFFLWPDDRVSLALPGRVAKIMAAIPEPFQIHIATEGPVGLAVRRWCRRRGRPFTTAFHSLFPAFARIRFGIPEALIYRYLRWFHSASRTVIVPSASLAPLLQSHGIGHVAVCGHGVDIDRFAPAPKSGLHKRPILLFVGRVAEEKGIEDFVRLPVAGTKMVVGDGPSLPRLRAAHPDIVFRGILTGASLAEAYAQADLLVFPSRTDTFGLVILEALASGVPVAAYPVTGPLDILEGTGAGCLSWDLAEACRQALTLPASQCRATAERHAWPAQMAKFLAAIDAVGTGGTPDLRVN